MLFRSTLERLLDSEDDAVAARVALGVLDRTIVANPGELTNAGESQDMAADLRALASALEEQAG